MLLNWHTSLHTTNPLPNNFKAVHDRRTKTFLENYVAPKPKNLLLKASLTRNTTPSFLSAQEAVTAYKAAISDLSKANGINVSSSGSVADRPATVTISLENEEKSEPHCEEKNEHDSKNDNGVKKPPELARLKSNADIKRDTSGLTTQYMAAGIVNIGALAAGVCVSWSSSALPLLGPHSPIPLTTSEASWVASLLCLGAFCGAVPAGLLSEHFGRKKTLLYLALPMLVSWILVASSPSGSGLYVGRFVGGVAVGAFSVAVPPYVADVAEPAARASAANFYHVQFTGGILCGYIIGLARPTTLISVISASIPVVYFVAFIFLPESPTYLISQGKVNEAKASLRYFRGIDNNIDEELTTLKENIKNAFKNKTTFKYLFTTRATVKALIVSFGLMVFQQLSGIYAIIFYAKPLLENCHTSMSPSGVVIIMGFCLVSSTYFSTMLLNKYPRRPLLLLSFGFMAPSLASLGVLFLVYESDLSNINPSLTWIPMLSLCVFVIAYAMGVGPIPWLMLRETFPTNITRRATALTAGFHWFLAFAVTKLYQNMMDHIGTGWVLWNFGVMAAVGVIFVYFLVPETKDRTLEEIQNEFKGIQKKKKHRHIIEVESISEL